MKILICTVLLIGTVLGVGDRTPTNFKRFFQVLSREERERQLTQPALVNVNGPSGGYFQPCAGLPVTTTTPLPFIGPMCPVYPLGGQVPQPGALVRPQSPNIALESPGNVYSPLDPYRLPVGFNVYPPEPPRQPNPNVYQPSEPTRPTQPVLVGLGNFQSRPERPNSGNLLVGGPGIGQGGNVLLSSPSENRPVPVPFPYGQPQPQREICPLNDGVQFPFVPHGFNFANPHLISHPQECPLSPRPDVPFCSTLEILDKFQLRIMYRYIIKSGLEQLFQQTTNYTVFVPVDPAFASLPDWFVNSLENDVKLLRAFVLNHYIKVDISLHDLGNEYLIMNGRPGGHRLRGNVYFPELPYRVYTLDGSKVILGDIPTRTGRLHFVNKVIVPNPPRSAAQYLPEVPEFTNFMSIVTAANMLDVFQDSDPSTFFIPYNDAFRGFDIQSVLRNTTSARNFVNYHIVRGTYYSNGLLNGQYLTTLYNKEVKLSVTSDGFTKTLTAVNSVNRVLKSDIPLLNGVAHVLNGVLSSAQEFYEYPQMNEFQMNFGTLKRNFVITESQLKEEASSA